MVRAQSGRNLARGARDGDCRDLASRWCATRWVSRPLGRVGDAARALAAGDMSRRARPAPARRDRPARRHLRRDGGFPGRQGRASCASYADSLERRVEERTADVTGLLRAVPDLIFKVSADGRLVDYVPAKGEEIDAAGRTSSSAGRSPMCFRTKCRPAPSSASSARSPARRSRRTNTASWSGGEERHYEARISPSSQGTVVVLVRDITERRRGEERTRFLASAAASLSSSLDYGSTVETLANLAVPFLADLCIVDLLEHGHIRTAPRSRRRRRSSRPWRMTARERYPVRPDQRASGRAGAERRRDDLYADWLRRHVPRARRVGRARVTGEGARRRDR